MPAGVSPNKTTISARVPNDVFRAAKARADTEGTPLSEVVVRSLRTYAKGKPKTKEPTSNAAEPHSRA